MEIEVLSTNKNQLLACDHNMYNKHTSKGWVVMCFSKTAFKKKKILVSYLNLWILKYALFSRLII